MQRDPNGEPEGTCAFIIEQIDSFDEPIAYVYDIATTSIHRFAR